MLWLVITGFIIVIVLVLFWVYYKDNYLVNLKLDGDHGKLKCTLSGNAQLTQEGVRLTSGADTAGGFNYVSKLPSKFQVTFDYWIIGKGGNGLLFYFDANTNEISEKNITTSGVYIAVQSNSSTGPFVLQKTSKVPLNPIVRDENWHTVNISVDGEDMIINVDGTNTRVKLDPSILTGTNFGMFGKSSSTLSGPTAVGSVSPIPLEATYWVRNFQVKV